MEPTKVRVLVEPIDEIILESDDMDGNYPGERFTLKEFLHDNTDKDVDAPELIDFITVCSLKVGDETIVNLSKIRRIA